MRAPLLLLLSVAACGDSLRSLPAHDVGGACAGTVDACTGAACDPCAAAPANASGMQCVQGACVFACNPGFLRCDSECCTASAVAAGGDTSCAIVQGAVRCWGSNAHGQLGVPASQLAKALVPVQVAGISGATRIAVGASHACAIAGGQVLCWGGNDSGQLGQPAGADSPTPVAAPAGDSPDRIAAGARHTCAISVAGAVTCWGANDAGQAAAPAVTASLVGAGLAWTCAAISGGAVRCWGQGAGTPLASGTTALAAGSAHACAVSQNDVQCWGAGAQGQLGDGKSTDSATPVRVSGISGPTGVLAAGGAHSCAVVDAGGGGTALYCWGSNASGQLGLGSLDGQPQAEPVGLAGVAELAAGASHTCARLGSGAVLCWGANDQGQAGTGAADATVLTPAFVSGR